VTHTFPKALSMITEGECPGWAQDSRHWHQPQHNQGPSLLCVDLTSASRRDN
jgi:hypothetical protein